MRPRSNPYSYILQVRSANFLYVTAYLDPLKVILPSRHLGVLGRIDVILRWRFRFQRGLLIARRSVELSILGRIDVRIIPVPVVIWQLTLREIRLRPVQLMVVRCRRVRQRLLLLLMTLPAVFCNLRSLLTIDVGLDTLIGTLLAHLGFIPPVLARRESIDLVESQLLLRFLMRLVVLPWIFRFHRRVYLIERELAGILRLRTCLLGEVMLPFRLRMAARVPLIESQAVLVLRPCEPFVSAEPMPVLEILVTVFENLPRLILLFEL